MGMGVKASVMGILEKITTRMGADVSAYSNIETIFNGVKSENGSLMGNLIVCKDGSLATIVRYEGSRVIMGREEIIAAADNATEKLAGRMKSSGYSIEVNITRDPEGGRAITDRYVAIQKHVAKEIGLLADTVLEEQKNFLPRWVVREDIFFVLRTRRSVLLREDEKDEERERAELLESRRRSGDLWSILLPQAPNSQRAVEVSQKLLARHQSFVQTVLDGLGIAFDFSLPDAHQAARIIYDALNPTKRESQWKAILANDIPVVRSVVNDTISVMFGTAYR